MTALKLRKWDSAEHFKTEEDMALSGGLPARGRG
jgi:hypothetical protein